jgi:CheY-like chemotaxis protein
MDSHVQELRLSGYKVSLLQNVDEALVFFEVNLSNIYLVILDIMMPFGSTFKDDDTKHGLRTGLLVYDRIRKKAPNMPVIILTNVTDEKVVERFRKENKCWFLRKEENLPFELVQEIRRILSA